MAFLNVLFGFRVVSSQKEATVTSRRKDANARRASDKRDVMKPDNRFEFPMPLIEPSAAQDPDTDTNRKRDDLGCARLICLCFYHSFCPLLSCRAPLSRSLVLWFPFRLRLLAGESHVSLLDDYCTDICYLFYIGSRVRASRTITMWCVYQKVNFHHDGFVCVCFKRFSFVFFIYFHQSRWQFVGFHLSY